MSTPRTRELLTKLGLPEAQALAYGQFLDLARLYPDKVLVPPALADKGWHAHLEHPDYEEDCQAICGFVPEHDPTKYGDDQFWADWEVTRDLYRQHYDIELPDREASEQGHEYAASTCILVASTCILTASTCIRKAHQGEALAA